MIASISVGRGQALNCVCGKLHNAMCGKFVGRWDLLIAPHVCLEGDSVCLCMRRGLLCV